MFFRFCRFDFRSEGGNLDKIEFEILMLCKLSTLFYKNLHNFDENFKLKFTSICTRLVESFKLKVFTMP